MKQKVFYFNDSDKAVCVSVDTLYQENTVVLQPLQIGEFELELNEGEAVWIKRWNRSVLISKVDASAVKNIQGLRPSSQREVSTSQSDQQRG